MMKIKKKIVVIGGGTGTFSILSGLKKYTNNITAIVSMADSGGSARKERDEWGLLPSSDIRKSLIALADASSKDIMLLRRLFQYRYSEGDGIAGMSFGNLFLIALTKLIGSQSKAIVKAGEILKIKGRVLPVTHNQVDLVATYEDGTVVVGEHFIDEPRHNGRLKIVRLETKPVVETTQDVKDAIIGCDAVIIGPGGFYTTILANLIITGVVESLQKSRAPKIFIMNLMTELGQTYQFKASTFLQELNKYLPSRYLDYVLINNATIPDNILRKYEKVDALPVVNDLPLNTPYKVITADLLNPKLVKRQNGDTLNRSLIRHSPEKLSLKCLELLNLL